MLILILSLTLWGDHMNRRLCVGVLMLAIRSATFSYYQSTDLNDFAIATEGALGTAGRAVRGIWDHNNFGEWSK